MCDIISCWTLVTYIGVVVDRCWDLCVVVDRCWDLCVVVDRCWLGLIVHLIDVCTETWVFTVDTWCMSVCWCLLMAFSLLISQLLSVVCAFVQYWYIAANLLPSSLYLWIFCATSEGLILEYHICLVLPNLNNSILWDFDSWWQRFYVHFLTKLRFWY